MASYEVCILMMFVAGVFGQYSQQYNHQLNQHQQYLQPQQQDYHRPQYQHHQQLQITQSQYQQPHHRSYEQEHYVEPKYSFEYQVKDEHHGDYKSQHETRDGHVVKGFYELIQPDGKRRIVEYTADHDSGFNAIVHYEPVQGYKAPQPQRYNTHYTQPIHQQY